MFWMARDNTQVIAGQTVRGTGGVVSNRVVAAGITVFMVAFINTEKQLGARRPTNRVKTGSGTVILRVAIACLGGEFSCLPFLLASVSGRSLRNYFYPVSLQL